jgi:hypothetical protein
MKELLQAVRRELEAHYVPLVLDERQDARNYSGTGEGCCVMGALRRVTRRVDWGTIIDIRGAIRASAGELFKELEGTQRHRSLALPLGVTPGDYDGSKCSIDDFSIDPATYVNNHLGKEAILSVIDHAIAQAS